MFQGLSTALTALYADRQALETTGNNIANVNTKGYARQRVDQSNINSGATSFWSTGNNVGAGVMVTGITRITDQFLNAQAYSAHASSSQSNGTNAALQNIQTAFNEPSDEGLQKQLTNFWGSWDSLAQNVGAASARTNVIENAKALTSNIQQVNTSLDQQSAQSVATLKGDVSQINSYAQSIADLNKAIKAETQSGASPNGLMDQRDALVNKLADLVGINVQPSDSNGINILVGGSALVRDSYVQTLQVDDSGAPVKLRWDDDGNPLTVTDGQELKASGGDLSAQLDIINNVVPKYKTMMNTFASNLISTVNAQHQAGQDLNGTAGIAFFTGTDASNIAVNDTVASNTDLVAASKTGGAQLDASNALSLANLGTLQGGPDDSYKQLINVLGSDAQRAANSATINQNITNNADASVQSTSGVNLDEEMTNMVSYQRAYESAAKYLSVINDTLDSLLSLVR